MDNERKFWLCVGGLIGICIIVLASASVLYNISYDTKELAFKVAQVNNHEPVIHSLREHICS